MKSPFNIFISFHHLDVEIAQQFHDALNEVGYSVWWDRNLQGSQEWHGEIDIAIKRAGAVIVLWSPNSIKSTWVKHEASQAIAGKKYVPVKIQSVTIPSPYDRLQYIDLEKWNYDTKAAGFINLMKTIDKLVPWWMAPFTFLGRNIGIFSAISVTLAALWLLENQRRTLVTQTIKQEQISETLSKQSKAQGKIVEYLNKQKGSLDNQVKIQIELSKSAKELGNSMASQLAIQLKMTDRIDEIQDKVDGITDPVENVSLGIILDSTFHNALLPDNPLSVHFTIEKSPDGAQFSKTYTSKGIPLQEYAHYGDQNFLFSMWGVSDKKDKKKLDSKTDKIKLEHLYDKVSLGYYSSDMFRFAPKEIRSLTQLNDRLMFIVMYIDSVQIKGKRPLQQSTTNRFGGTPTFRNGVRLKQGGEYVDFPASFIELRGSELWIGVYLGELSYRLRKVQTAIP